MKEETPSRFQPGSSVELFADGARRTGLEPRTGWKRNQEKIELAKKLGVEPETLLPSDGYYPSPIYIGSTPYFLSAEIDQYLEYWARVGAKRPTKRQKIAA